MAKKTIFVSDPYREVCYLCCERTQVVACHFPVDAATNRVASTRLCKNCLGDVIRRLMNALPQGIAR